MSRFLNSSIHLIFTIDNFSLLQVDKNEIDQDGYNGLHLAADNGQLDVVNILLEAGADINRVVYDGALSALHLALSKVQLYMKI